jgi:hypothetical protein
MALSSGRPGSQPKLRDPLADYLKAVNDQIAERVSVGAGATPYLLTQKAELEARLGIAKAVEPRPAYEAGLEHTAADPLPEDTAPRRPGRPRKNPDADSTAGS